MSVGCQCGVGNDLQIIKFNNFQDFAPKLHQKIPDGIVGLVKLLHVFDKTEYIDENHCGHPCYAKEELFTLSFDKSKSIYGILIGQNIIEKLHKGMRCNPMNEMQRYNWKDRPSQSHNSKYVFRRYYYAVDDINEKDFRDHSGCVWVPLCQWYGKKCNQFPCLNQKHHNFGVKPPKMIMYHTCWLIDNDVVFLRSSVQGIINSYSKDRQVDHHERKALNDMIKSIK